MEINTPPWKSSGSWSFSVPVEFTMERKGRFRVRSLGDNHCGMNPGVDGQSVTYRLSLVCRDKSLDPRGFLFDQAHVDLWIPEFIRDHRARLSSCELLCERLLDFLIRQTTSENPACQISKGSLRLSPWPHKAAVTCDWTSRRPGSPRKPQPKIPPGMFPLYTICK